MLPFLTAAGHFKHGQQSLPLYIKEMKNLPEEVEDMFTCGAFVGRRSSGRHNAVSPDMLLEQTYNADAKEESGLDGKMLNMASRTKWVSTKPTAAALSAQLKDMLHLTSSHVHHEAGQARVSRDTTCVLHIIAAIEDNPFLF